MTYRLIALLSATRRPTLGKAALHPSFRSFSSINDLQQRTEKALGLALDDSDTVSLLKEWNDMNDESASQQMNLILEQWLKSTKRPKTTEPFYLVLNKHRDENDGPSAARVLDRWGDLLGGDLTMSPPLSAFHLVLQSYGTTDSEACRELLKFLERSYWEGNVALAPKVETYSHVIFAIHKNEDKLPSDIMNRLPEAYDAEPKTPESSYHMLRAYAKGLAVYTSATDSLRYFVDLENILHRTYALQLALKMENPPEPVVSLLGTAYLTAFTKLKESPPKLEHAQRGKRMIDYLESLNLEGLPWINHYGSVAELWSTKVCMKNDADAVLEDLMSSIEKMPSKESFRIYSRIVSLWCLNGKVEDAEDLLPTVMSLKKQGLMEDVSPRDVTLVWNNVLNGHFRNNSLQRVVTLWDQMQELNSVRNDVMSYSIVLKALSRISHPRAVTKAHKILETVKDHPAVKVNASHYGSLISCWSRSPAQGAADRALDILDELQNVYEKTGDNRLRPEQAHFTAVISAFARSRRKHGKDKALAVFERMKEYYLPDIMAYTSMINALACGRTKEDAERAEEFLEEMESLAQEGSCMKPNAVTYTSIILAWSNANDPEAPERAEQLLERLQEKFFETGDEALRADSITYGAVFAAWSKSTRSDSGERAEVLKKKIEAMEEETGQRLLNSIMYTNIIVAHWRANQPHAPQKCAAILEEMKQRAANGDLKCLPDTIAYTTVIQAWARSKAGNKASEAWKLLNEMCEAYKGGNMSLKPNVISFTACINACAYTRGPPEQREEAVKIALMAFNEFDSYDYGKTSHIMYATLLKTFGRQVLDLDARLKYSELAFSRCCQDGQADDSVIQMIMEFTPELYAKLPRNQSQQVEIRPEWSMNVQNIHRH